jgi:hypothetical protein
VECVGKEFTTSSGQSLIVHMVSRRVQLYAMLVPNETGDFIDIKQCEELLMPSPSNTAPSRPLIFHPCQERGNSCCAHVAMLELTRQRVFHGSLEELQSSSCCCNLWWQGGLHYGHKYLKIEIRKYADM